MELSLDTDKPVAPELLQLALRDKMDLHSHYMPFIKGGGIFVPTNKEYNLGDSTGVVLRFLDRGKKFVLTGNVVWISPEEGTSSGMKGVGIQFGGESKAAIKRAIESYLGDLANRPALKQAY